MYPEETDTIEFFGKVIDQEAGRKPGSLVENRSFKADGWGYSMLRGPGSWDQRMETLLSSKHLLLYPGDHVSDDALGICLYAHGALMTPRYGYHWLGYPDFLLNRARIDGETKEDPGQQAIWGSFLHFDPNPEMPSAIAYTDMPGERSTRPGRARQERWCVQLPEYLFDAYFIRMRDNSSHVLQWGFRNLGEMAVVTPANAPLTPAKNPDGSPWDPFGYYRRNTRHEGQTFNANDMWQGEWTMNDGSINFDAACPNPPRGARLRLTMAGEPATQIITAWLTGPGRNSDAFQARQDFVVVRRQAAATCFASTFEPVAVGGAPLVQAVVVTAKDDSGAQAIEVKTSKGSDWFLVGGLPDFTKDLKTGRSVRTLGPFTTDAALAVVRVEDAKVVRAMLAGGKTLRFATPQVTTQFNAENAGTWHFLP
jgi:hypothetical protein